MCKFTVILIVTTFKEFLWDGIVENEVSVKESVKRIVSGVRFSGRTKTTNSTLLIVL